MCNCAAHVWMTLQIPGGLLTKNSVIISISCPSLKNFRSLFLPFLLSPLFVVIRREESKSVLGEIGWISPFLCSFYSLILIKCQSHLSWLLVNPQGSTLGKMGSAFILQCRLYCTTCERTKSQRMKNLWNSLILLDPIGQANSALPILPCHSFETKSLALYRETLFLLPFSNNVDPPNFWLPFFLVLP